jgi:vesicular inhibitory amino acid transporter
MDRNQPQPTHLQPNPTVGLVTSVTYLTCAYTLPAWFALKLLADKLSSRERFLLIAIIPLSIVLSATGFAASVKTYITEASGGEGM